MSGIGFSELVVLFVIGLLILGPERLPRVATQIGRWVGRARRTANQLRYQLEREITLADIDAKTDKKPKKRTQSKSSDTGVAGSEQREAKDASPKDSEPDTSAKDSEPDASGSEPGEQPGGESDDEANPA